MTPRRVVLVHDWLNQIGGAENVLEVFVGMFSAPPVYTSMYAPDRMPPAYRTWDIRTSFMQHLPGIATHHQAYLPFYPLAFSRMHPPDCDVILSNKSGFCHGIPVPRGAVHICYCLAPTRFLWQYEAYSARESFNGATEAVLQPLISTLQRWDYAAAQRVHHFIAISTEIRQRIRTYYNRDSTIIFPPVDIDRFQVAGGRPGSYFLAGGRHIPYKRLDLAVRACTQLRLPLLVFGDGRDRQALEKMAGPTVKFLGRVGWDQLAELYAGAQAFIFPGLEDFGIAPLEAQACGRPVIAYAGGGALDTVLPGRTGELFCDQAVESLSAVLAGFDPGAYDPGVCRSNAESYSTARFQSELLAFIQQQV